MTSHFPMRCFAFDQFGPLSIRPCHGSTWAPESTARSGCPRRITARTASATSTAATASAMTSCGVSPGAAKAGTTRCPRSSRSGRPAPTAHPIYVIMDNLSANKTPAIRAWAVAQQGRVVSDPDLGVLGEPDRGPVRAVAHLHHGRIRPPQPPGAGASAAGLPALAQHPRPPPRRPRRTTSRTRPDPQRTPPTLGPTTSGMTR